MSKLNRQNFILTLIKEQSIKTQDQLVDALKSHGFIVTQATVSRDIQNLSLIKVPSPNGMIYQQAIASENELGKGLQSIESIFNSSVLEVTGVDALIVVHTVPGAASTVAFHLDQNRNDEILGTIAGDDTLLVILSSQELRFKWLERLKGYL